MNDTVTSPYYSVQLPPPPAFHSTLSAGQSAVESEGPWLAYKLDTVSNGGALVRPDLPVGFDSTPSWEWTGIHFDDLAFVLAEIGYEKGRTPISVTIRQTLTEPIHYQFSEFEEWFCDVEA